MDYLIKPEKTDAEARAFVIYIRDTYGINDAVLLSKVVDRDSTGKTYKSTTGGENAVLVNGSKIKMTKATVKKTGDSSSESADFYGTNAAVLAKGGATLTIKSSKITSKASVMAH